MRGWVKKTTAGYPKGKPGSPVGVEPLEKIREKLKALSLAECIEKFNLKPDRVDVIVPGAMIYLKAMDWSGCRKVRVPMQGLADGMAWVLHTRIL
jgi:exopolyphosphatase/guanosine-5'-triphosphate,3'-diphosphate pyrophosphatase